MAITSRFNPAKTKMFKQGRQESSESVCGVGTQKRLQAPTRLVFTNISLPTPSIQGWFGTAHKNPPFEDVEKGGEQIPTRQQKTHRETMHNLQQAARHRNKVSEDSAWCGFGGWLYNKFRFPTAVENNYHRDDLRTTLNSNGQNWGWFGSLSFFFVIPHKTNTARGYCQG